MGAEYDAAARWRAMELYCADRLTFAQVAEATGRRGLHVAALGRRIPMA